MAATNVWDETAPPGTAQASTLDTIIQQLKLDIRERMSQGGHYWNVDVNDDGFHKNLVIQNAPGGGAGAVTANKELIKAINGSLTGANAQSAVEIAMTWNTSGAPTGIKMTITDTASDATSRLLDLIVGASSKFSVDKAGAAILAGLLTLSNGQIKFPAVQNPSSNKNTLDDYVEDVWTPVLGGSGGTTGQTYATQSGQFVKIGRMVFASFCVILSAKGTLTGQVQIQGLPYGVYGVGNFAGLMDTAALRWANLATNWVNVVAQSVPGAAAFQIRGTNAAGGSNVTDLVTADIANNSEFRGMLVYQANP